jgi:hypothetical protein
LDHRALAFYEEARDLVGIDGPRDQIIGWFGSEEEQLKVVSIFGVGGQGKTTLAMEPWRCTAKLKNTLTAVLRYRYLEPLTSTGF